MSSQIAPPTSEILIAGPYQGTAHKSHWYELMRGGETLGVPLSQMTPKNKKTANIIIDLQRNGAGLGKAQKQFLENLFNRAQSNAHLKSWQVFSLIGVAIVSVLAYRRGTDTSA